MSIVSRYISHGEQKLGYQFPIDMHGTDPYSMDYQPPIQSFTPEQRHFLIDTAKVIFSDVVASGLHQVARLRRHPYDTWQS